MELLENYFGGPEAKGEEAMRIVQHLKFLNNFILVTSGLAGKTQRVSHFRDSCVVALAPGPGTKGWGHLQVALISIRFERFPVFHASASGGGHEFGQGANSVSGPVLSSAENTAFRPRK